MNDEYPTELSTLYSPNSNIHLFLFHLLYQFQYDIPMLTKVCIENMGSCLRVDNAAKIFYLADLHQLAELKSFAGNFIANNRREVRNSEGWAEFVKPNPVLIEELFDMVGDFNDSVVTKRARLE